MARKKQPPKPLLALKFEFADALENALQQTTMLITAVEFALRVGKLPPEAKLELERQVKATRAAIYTTENGGADDPA